MQVPDTLRSLGSNKLKAMDPLALVAGLAIGGLAGTGVVAVLARRKEEESRARQEESRARLEQSVAQEREVSGRAEAGLNDLKVERAAESARVTAQEEELARQRTRIQEEWDAARLLRNEAEADRAEATADRSRIAALTLREARAEILRDVEAEVAERATARVREIETEIAGDAERRARIVLLETIERMAPSVASAATATIIELPSEDLKGRIIGREGRNIRSFETITGTDLLMDEGSDTVTISSFDPVRREIARLTLLNLMVDGRIHPSKIEEHFAKATVEVDRAIAEAGERAAEQAEVIGLSPAVLTTLGRLRFRTSYAQNVLDHSVETARLSGMIAAELGFDVALARRAGLLHDIGKALGDEWEGPHAIAGRDYLKSAGETDPILLNAVGAHHREIEPEHPESLITIVADAVSAARPGARRESLENYMKRLTALEEIAKSLPGVESVFAVQAGRELRLAVRPDEIDDRQAARLAESIAKRIEAEVPHAGAVKVTVIREIRATATTRAKTSG